jgi:hypothetical protein
MPVSKPWLICGSSLGGIPDPSFSSSPTKAYLHLRFAVHRVRQRHQRSCTKSQGYHQRSQQRLAATTEITERGWTVGPVVPGRDHWRLPPNLDRLSRHSTREQPVQSEYQSIIQHTMECPRPTAYRSLAIATSVPQLKGQYCLRTRPSHAHQHRLQSSSSH